MKLHWSAEFVGLPWAEKGRDRAGVDCWGLVVIAFASRGIALPSYAADYVCVAEREQNAKLFDREFRSPWIDVAVGTEREWDVVLFRRMGVPAHVGIVVGEGRMLHISTDEESMVEAYAAGRWRQKLISVHRHRDLA